MPAPANETGLHDQELHSPALDAIKEVYLQAYNYGMSTAFITGRNEGSRDHTEKNLKRVGFGEKCPVDKEGTIIRTQDKPCYIGLHLRDLKSALLNLMRTHPFIASLFLHLHVFSMNDMFTNLKFSGGLALC